MKLVSGGLDIYGWGLCVAVGSFGWIVSLVLKIIPFDLIMPNYGDKDIDQA